MGLHVRTVMPYALPGVLALLACWWFFSRKKDGHSKRPSSAEDALEELLTEEIPSTSRAQHVQLDKEEEGILEDPAFSLSLDALDTSLSDASPVCKLQEELPIQNMAERTLQESTAQQLVKRTPQSLVANERDKMIKDDEICVSSVLKIAVEADTLVKDNCITSLADVEEECPVLAKPPCVCRQGNEVQELSTKVIDHLSSDSHGFVLSEMSCQTEALNRITERDSLVHQNVESCEGEMNVVNASSTLGEIDAVESLSQEADFSMLKSSTFSTTPCHCDQSASHEMIHQHNLGKGKICTQVEDIKTKQIIGDQGVFFPAKETQTDDANEVNLTLKVDEVIPETQSLESCQLEQITGGCLGMYEESNLMEVKDTISHGVEPLKAGPLSHSCIESIVEVVKESSSSEMIDAFSKSVGKDKDAEGLKEVNTKTFMADYEAKIVEQLAINIISQVIVAARQEILSSSVSNPVHSEEYDSPEKDAQCTNLVTEKDNVPITPHTQSLNADSTCESTQTDPSQTKDLENEEVTSDLFPHGVERNNADFKSVQEMPSMSDFSPVHRSAEFFEESHMAMEDSSISACTSEEGIGLDDPLQSTVLSTVCVGSFDSLSSSGIELSRGMFNVSTDSMKVVKVVESEPAGYSNGDIKRGSPDLNCEGPVTADSEVDHSGGSDVNSMDSVDSGCALGNGDGFQNVKQKSELKKADLVIWEFEVPKYLVGRLIGKQGRFVSFLKQSSGAKIYISTVPYTQDIQICHLEGSQQQIDRALGLIRKKFKDLNLTNIFAPPPPLIPLPVASWLSLPNNVSVEVVVVNVVNAGHMFVQQRTHPTFHALCGLDHHMSLCYSQPSIPTLPTPAEVGILCAAPVGPNVWWRAQVMAYFEDSEEVEILYVDYGGYNRVKIQTLRQIRSDFVSLPFQGVEVLLDNVIPLGDDDHFSAEADEVVKELTTGAPMLTQVTNYDEATRLPLVQLWRLNPEETVSINRTLVDRGFAEWIESY